MPIKAKPGNQAPLIKPGMYVARCYEIIHLGTTYSEKWAKFRDEVRIGWELPTELVVFNEEKGEQPQSLSKTYTLSMYAKAALRQDIEGWLGKGFTDKEADDFDVLSLAGEVCMLNVVHETSKASGKVYANIKSITPLVKGTKAPAAINPPKLFDFDENFLASPEEQFPDWIADQIRESQEYKHRFDTLMGADHEKAVKAASGEQKGDDPF